MLDDTGTRLYPIVRIKQYRFEGKVNVHINMHGVVPLLQLTRLNRFRYLTDKKRYCVRRTTEEWFNIIQIFKRNR